ncbi:hypothetical protein J6V86_03440 [bacterium]|nr:hypothetical protein [bacterium]
MPAKIFEVQAATNNVPAYYYANYKFIDDWDKIWDIFRTIKSRYDLELSINQSMLSELYAHFVKSFPHLTPYHKTVYEKCTLIADELRRNGADNSSLMEELL